MVPSTQHPRLTVVVANSITGDSRVQKTALSAAHAGWEVTLIGRSMSGSLERSWLGPVKVIRVPVERHMMYRERERRRDRVTRRMRRGGFRSEQEARSYAAARESRARLRTSRLEHMEAHAAPLGRAAAKAWAKVGDIAARVRIHAYERDTEDKTELLEAVGDWRRDTPSVLDIDLAFGPAIERSKPDVIHANDIKVLPATALTVGRMRAAGHQVAWLYDAHEYVAGVEWPTPRTQSAYPAIEHEFIGSADAVVTVSPELAKLLQDDHGLPQMPLVVRNAPVRAAIGVSAPSVRAVAGVADDAPLLVYAGNVHAARGLRNAVEALTGLPECHLALVVGSPNQELRRLLRSANKLGIRERIHVVPYVAPDQVADYLSTADIGLICFSRTANHEISLPTKLAEYLHARLPVVVSDVEALSAYVREHEIGEVFVSGDTESLRQGIAKVASALEQYRDHITEPILTELSWENQVRGLLDLYRGISGMAEPTPLAVHRWEVSERPRRLREKSLEDAKGHGGNWRPLGATPIRLGLGPANHAGQLAALAGAVTAARPDVSAEVVMHIWEESFDYPADLKITLKSLRKLERQLEEMRRFLPRYTHLVADAFRPVFGTLNGNSIEGDLTPLRASGIKVALLAHGSEIRHPGNHLERNRGSLFRDAPEEVVAKLQATAERNQRIARRSKLPLYVTTPDLLGDLPQAVWMPLTVDVDAWACPREVMERPKPVVLHAPSKRWTKGTRHVLPQLESLHERGLIELRLVEGVPWKEMREQVHAADLVIDQFGVGAYGVFACEAMAAGKPVLAYLSDDVLKHLDADCPVVNTEADKVGEAVTALLDDRDRTRAIAAQSARFAREWHDGRRAVAALNPFLGQD